MGGGATGSVGRGGTRGQDRTGTVGEERKFLEEGWGRARGEGVGGPAALTSPASNPSLSQRVRGARLALQLHWGPGFRGPAEAAAGEGMPGVWAGGRLARVLALTPSSGAFIPELVSSAGEWH